MPYVAGLRVSSWPGEKCLEIQNCVNSAPIVIILVSKLTLTNGEYGKIVFCVW